MKKILLSVPAICVAFSLHAQLEIAPIGGLNISNLKTEQQADIKLDARAVARYYIGVQAGYGFSEKLKAGLSVQYATKGYKLGEPASKNTAEMRNTYLEMVPYIEYKFLHFLGVYAGPSIGLLLDEAVKVGGEWSDPAISLIEKQDIGGTAGIRLYAKNIFFNLSFARSLLSISEITYTDENGESDGSSKHYNQTIAFGLGYNFQVKKN